MSIRLLFRNLVLAVVSVCLIQTASGEDWPGWRGPRRDGISVEKGWSWDWGTNGPPQLWRASVGKGFSSFAVVEGRVYTMGNSNDVDTVFCFQSETGKLLWRHSYPCEAQPLSYEGGPGSTPAVASGRVFTFSKEGHLFCLDAATGVVIWTRKFELWPRLEGDWQNTWRYAGSPLVLNDRVYMSIGQAGMALSTHDGSVVWQSSAGHPGYSSPVPFNDNRSLAFFSGRAVYGTDAATGRQLWSVPWKTLWDLNAADPIISDGKLFVSSGNGVGSALFDLAEDPPRQLWRNKTLMNTMNSSILWNGFLFGFNDSRLMCVSWETGEERWMTRELRKGSLIMVDAKLLLLSETGKLVVAEPSSREFRPLAQAQVLTGRCWTSPVLSGGRIFVRNAEGTLVCLDVRPEKQRF